MPASELRQKIADTLHQLQLDSPAAEELLMATAAQESHLGQYRHQINGPALGIFQMEPEDHNDIWLNYLKYQPTLVARLTQSCQLAAVPPHPDLLEVDDAYAIAMARIHYLRCPRALPDATDLSGLWMYYKVNYNSLQGAATQAQFYSNYHRLVGGSAQ